MCKVSFVINVLLCFRLRKLYETPVVIDDKERSARCPLFTGVAIPVQERLPSGP